MASLIAIYIEFQDYQKKTLDQVKIYLKSLAEYRGKYEKAIAVDIDHAINFPFKAGEKACPELVSESKSFHSSKNGLRAEGNKIYTCRGCQRISNTITEFHGFTRG